MTAALLSALLSHWWRNPVQLFTLLAGLSLGTALWTGVQAINAEARASYDDAARTLDEGQLAQLATASGAPISEQTYVALRRAGWLVSPVIEGRLGSVRIIGIDPLTLPRDTGAARMMTGADLSGFLIPPGQILAQAETLNRLPDTDAARIATPGAAPGVAITDIGVAQLLLNRVGQIDRLMVTPEQPLGQRPLADVAPDLLLTAAQGSTDVARLTDSFHLNLTAFGLLSFVVGLFIVHGAIGLAFEQRRPMLRSLRALGAPLNRLIALMVLELAGLALIAGGVGIALGYAMAAALLPDVAATLRGLYGAEVAGQLVLRPVWVISGLAMALGGTAAAAAGSLWSLARMPLLASALPQAWGAARTGRAQVTFALVLLGLAGALTQWGQGLLAGFVLLGALLIGGALLLPPILRAVLHWAEARARGPLAQWFWADTRQQLPGLSLALMALLLAMAANVGVSTMVSSFRLTFVAFLDQRLASELYVTTANPAEADRVLNSLEGTVDAVLPLLSMRQSVAGQPVELYGARDHATYRDNWHLLQAVPDAWDALARGEGVLINEQLFRRAGLGLGAPVPLAQGGALPVLGIYGDYGNPIGQIVLTEAEFRARYPEVTALRFGLRLDPGRVPDLRAKLQADAGLPASGIVDQAAIKALSLDVFERTFLVTSALNMLTLAVAGFAILMGLLTLAAMRLPQMAPVWALGVTRRHLALLDLGRALLLAALTGVLALPLGLALAWALLAIVNVEAFGWRLPMSLFWMDYLRLGVFALLAAAVAAAWPAWRLSRMKPARLLGVFRHER
ncbi:ABC transporter permease [Gemmobacter lanyuensis]|uniref:ABC transporter permease n=1 Tax=Gemmobacter lanyuensis TaxID=1054497 RepID=A0A918J1H5_9RHOB|nr:ABC transporter permease [Gemmobacter lanyuensis]GGW38510.1 ABC transporter permease [Gemmobacter lanyuensis]